MNLLTAVLPGFRNLRAPLVGGYLWLFFIWLVLGGIDGLPTRETSDFYRDLFDLGDAIGPVGLAAVASFAAYVLGSLVAVASDWLGSRAAALHLRRTYLRQPAFDSDDARHVQLGRTRRVRLARLRTWSQHTAEVWVNQAWIYRPEYCGFLGGGANVQSGLAEIADREIKGAFEQLLEAGNQRFELTFKAEAADGDHLGEDDPPMLDARADINTFFGQPMVTLRDSTQDAWGQPYCKMPYFSADRDIFGERRVIVSRLMERSEFIANLIDQLYAEAELRLAMAWPLGAVIVAIAARTGALWLIPLLVVPVLLAWHALKLRYEANAALINTLKEKSTGELAELAPAYAQFRRDADRLQQTIEDLPAPTRSRDQRSTSGWASDLATVGEPESDPGR